MAKQMLAVDIDTGHLLSFYPLTWLPLSLPSKVFHQPLEWIVSFQSRSNVSDRLKAIIEVPEAHGCRPPRKVTACPRRAAAKRAKVRSGAGCEIFVEREFVAVKKQAAL